jgi:hypothetical protein
MNDSLAELADDKSLEPRWTSAEVCRADGDFNLTVRE